MKSVLFGSLLCLTVPSLALAQNSSPGTGPSGGAMGAAGATSLGTTMSTTGAGTPPSGTMAPPVDQNQAPPSGKGGIDNSPGNGGTRGQSGVGSPTP